MASTGLHGPHPLTVEGIDAAVKGTGPGAYALGRTGQDDTFYISYVGRSDTDLNARLKQWAGKYSKFKYGFLDSPKAAFEKECYLFHTFGETKLDNDVHPARPQGSGWKCPHCRNFD